MEIEPLWEVNKMTIHPALDFILPLNQAVICQWIPAMISTEYKDKLTGEIKEKRKREDILGLIFSDKKILYMDDEDKIQDFYIEVFPNKIKNRWSIKSIKEFCNGSKSNVIFKDIFDNIKNELHYYFEFPTESEYDFMALWAIGTYFFPLFNAYPYVFLNAIKRSGKSKLLRFMECVCFNAKNTLSMTSATMFRLIQNSRCTLLIDEVEKLPSKDMGDFRSMLLAGYKKGAKVPRAAEMKNRKAFIVEEYDVFSPKMLANISGIEDVLEDRCFTIIMLRTNNKFIANREIEYNDEKWQNIRDALYINLFQNWQNVKKGYDLLKDYSSLSSENDEHSVVSDTKEQAESRIKENKIKNIYTENLSQTTLTTLHKLTDIKSRDAELWLPILGLAITVHDDVFNGMVDFCLKKIAEKQQENITETTDIIFVESLLNVVKEDRFYSIKELTINLKEKFEDDAPDWLNTKWVGRSLKRLSFIEKRRRGTGIEIRLTPELIKNVAERVGIKIEEKENDNKTDEEQKILNS